MKVFDDRVRADHSYKTRTERAFPFLNRAARPDMHEVRGRIETWFSKYPSDAAAELGQRLRSTRDDTHHGALFELMVHELLLQLGWAIEIHPSMADTERQPDFLASKTGKHLIVEATECRPANSLWAVRPHEDAILDALERIQSPDFFLDVQTEGSLTRAIPAADIVDQIKRFLDNQDYDASLAIAEAAGPDRLPTIRIEQDSWAIEARPLPKHRLRGNVSARAIGIGPARVAFQDSVTPLRRAIRSKASRYERPTIPFLVAVNAPDADDLDVEEVLFGREQVSYTFATGSMTASPGRATDGLWVGVAGRPRHRRLSAVLVFRGIAPWSLGSVQMCLYVNPFANELIPAELLRLPHAAIEDGTLVRRPGVSAADIFGLGSIGG